MILNGYRLLVEVRLRVLRRVLAVDFSGSASSIAVDADLGPLPLSAVTNRKTPWPVPANAALTVITTALVAPIPAGCQTHRC